MKTKLYSLEHHEAFLNIDGRTLHSIEQKGEIFTARKNEKLCIEGNSADYLFFVLSGNILISKEDRIVAVLKENYGHFGWNRFEDNYAFTAISGPDVTEVFKIHKEAILNLFLKYKILSERLFVYSIPIGACLFIKKLHLENIITDSEELLASFKYEYFHPEQIVIRKGAEADKFYIIFSGSAKITTNNGPDGPEELLNYMKQGDYFGEIALLEERVRAVNVIAVEGLAVFSLTRDAFNLFMSNKKWEFARKHLIERVKTYNIAIKNTIIGSSPDCDFQISSDKIAPMHARLIRTTKKDGSVSYFIKPLADSSQYKLFVNKHLIKKETLLKENDEVFINSYRLVIDMNRHSICVQEIDYYKILVEKLVYKIKGHVIIDHISFSAQSGELVSIMGPSGSGKSTLTDLISGAKKQTGGGIFYNRDPLYENLEFYRHGFGYVPQDDILFSELTVFQNLYFAVKLREPFVKKERLEEKIDRVLDKLKLSDKKHHRIGDVERKGLSGGERKRVNIARGLVFNPHIFFLDEPTSGLSSKDSEDIVNLLRELADTGMLIFAVLHQPAPKIYRMFNKIVFLDNGGKLVYTGQVLDCIHHMKDAGNDMTPVECPECGTCQPELIFEILEERNEEGGRKYSPEFWKDRFQAKMEYESEDGEDGDDENGEGMETSKRKSRIKHKMNFSENMRQIGTLLLRTLFIKVKNWSNMSISLGVPVVIALLLALILHYSSEENAKYSFYQNKLISVYLFIGVIFSVFLGLTNSIKDIVSEQTIFIMESKVKLKIRWYVFSKFIILALIAAVQIFIFLLIGNFILDIHGVFAILFLYLYLASLFGVAFGLFLSSALRTSESAVNWIPLILIPQIILGGALIKFEEMSSYLYISSNKLVPSICQFVPSRWAHEALVAAQTSLNPRDRAVKRSIAAVKAIKNKISVLKKNGINDGDEIKRLKDERKRLRTEKGNIDSKYPNDMYRNKTLEEAVMDGSGIYAHYKGIYAKKDTKKKYFCLTTYDSKQPAEEETKTLWFNSPFYAEYKGILIGKKYYEIKTIVFNPIILLGMIILFLLLSMWALRIKIIKHLHA